MVRASRHEATRSDRAWILDLSSIRRRWCDPCPLREDHRDTRIGSYSYARSKSFPGLLVAAPDLTELSRVEKVGLIAELHEIPQSAFGRSGASAPLPYTWGSLRDSAAFSERRV